MMLGLGKTSLADLCAPEGKKSKKEKDSMHCEDEDREFKSKNLEAERRRRQKLGDKFLQLRALVPNITNMTKATIITDAMTYILELEKTAKDLSDQLDQMGADLHDNFEAQGTDKLDTQEDMAIWGIKPKVEVIQLNEGKLWIQIVCPKKRGGFSKLMEAINALGFHLKDTSATSSKGALLVTLSLEGQHEGHTNVCQIREFLLETIRSI